MRTMNITKKIMNPLGMVVNVVPSTPSTCKEEIYIVKNSHVRRELGEIVLPEVNVLFVVPTVEFTWISLSWVVLRVVDHDQTLRFLNHTEILHILPVIRDVGQHMVWISMELQF